MGRQRRKSAQILGTIEQRRLKLEEEIRNLESQPESPARNRQLATKKRLLLNVDKERYNWMGLEEDEELSTENFLTNVKAVIRQRKSGLAESIKGAIGMKILGTDPLISNAWAGGLMLRDMFRGTSSDSTDSPIGGNSPTTTPTDSTPTDSTPPLLAQISNTSNKIYELLNWVYTYRRARFREIMNLDNIKDAAIATTAQQALPPGEFQERLTDRDNDVENKVTDLIELTKEGLFGSPKLLGPAGPIAGLLEQVHKGILIQGDAISDLEPTEEESRESQMNRLARLDQFSKNKNLGNLAALGGTAAGAGGGFLSSLAAETGGTVLGNSLLSGPGKGLIPAAGKAIAGTGAGRAVAGVAGKVGLAGAGIIGLAATGIIMSASDFVKGWLYKHKEWGVGKASGALGSFMGSTGERGIWSIFGNMSKWGAIGALAGSPGSLPGMIAGGILGTTLGLIFSLIGGQKLSQWINGVGRWIRDELWEGMKNFVKNITEWLFPKNQKDIDKKDPSLHPPSPFDNQGNLNNNGNRILNSSNEQQAYRDMLNSMLQANTSNIQQNHISSSSDVHLSIKNSTQNPNSPGTNSKIAH